MSSVNTKKNGVICTKDNEPWAEGINQLLELQHKLGYRVHVTETSIKTGHKWIVWRAS